MTDECNKASQPKSKLVGWAIGLAVIVILAVMAVPGHGPQRTGYRMMSWQHMQNIALSLKAYQKDHSRNLPARLSELVPDYNDGPDLFYFASPYTTSVRPLDSSPMPALIDGFTPYGYGLLPDGEPYVFERPGMWADGTVAYLVLGHFDRSRDDWRSCRVTVEEFQKLLSKNFVPSPAPTLK